MNLNAARKLTEADYTACALKLIEEVANDSPEDLMLLREWLAGASSTKVAVENLIKYKWTPVGPREFIMSPAYMNAAEQMWPLVVDEFEELNSGKYTECVLTGGIGVAKTTIALYTQAYQLYVLSCMRNPHAVFDLDPNSEITIIFQSLNKNLAQDVDYQRFRSMVSNSPYFKSFFNFAKERESDMRFPNRIIVKPISGQDTGAIGQNVIGGIVDEINFMAVTEDSKKSRDGQVYDQAVSNYNSIATRRSSRFMVMGALPGMLCLVSSRNYPGQFTDVKEEEARTNPRIFIYDKRVWEIAPQKYSFHANARSVELIELYGEDYPFWFRLFVGDETRKPRILEDDEVVNEDEEALVMSVPIEHRKDFENKMLTSLRDIAGVATQALHPFISNTNAITACFGKVQSIASRPDCDFVASKIAIMPERIVHREEPRFAHIDLAISGDSAGVAIGHITEFVSISRGDYIETLPKIQMDMLLEVRPPKGGEIIFDKIRRILYLLRDELHVPLKYVSFDGFQSKDSMQILHQNGFLCGYRSMDVDTFAYDMLKQALYDGRVLAPAHQKVQTELVRLEFDVKKKKIDHPPNGSKDVADALAGVVCGLSMRRELWTRHHVPIIRMPLAFKEAKASIKEPDAPPAGADYKAKLRYQREQKWAAERKAAGGGRA